MDSFQAIFIFEVREHEDWVSIRFVPITIVKIVKGDFKFGVKSDDLIFRYDISCFRTFIGHTKEEVYMRIALHHPGLEIIHYNKITDSYFEWIP